MKLTRTSSFVAAGFLIMAIIECQAGKRHPASNPRDTPIVAGGGSIYGLTHELDTEGWKRKLFAKSYSASLHADVLNPGGIDNLKFTGFNNAPVEPVTGTNGWAISISNPTASGGKNANAVRFCSDKKCRASTTLMNGQPNSSRCQGSFDPKGRVYFRIRDGAQVVKSGSPIKQLDFHDTGSSCTPGKCDKVYDVTLETCSSSPHITPFTCQTDATGKHQICEIKVGNGKDH
jgi:hypothetical protein